MFVSVGMLEHVGLDHFQEISEIIHRCHRRHGPRTAALHRAELTRGLQPLDSQAHFPRAALFLRWGIAGGSGAEELLGSGRGKSADALRQDAGALAERFDESRQQVTRCMIRGSCGRGGCIWRDRSPRFGSAICSCFRSSFAGSEREPIFWTRDPLYTDPEPAARKPNRWWRAREGPMETCDVLIVAAASWLVVRVGAARIPGWTSPSSTNRLFRAIRSAADGLRPRFKRAGIDRR